MVNYIRAEFYKVFRRRYTWITLVVLLALEALMVAGWMFTNSHGNHVDFYTGAGMLCVMLALGFYATLLTCDMVFADQYKNGTMKNEVSFGIPRTRIYLGKFLVSLAVSLLFMAVMAAFYLGLCYLALFHDPEADAVAMQMVGYCLLTALPLWVGGARLHLRLPFPDQERPVGVRCQRVRVCGHSSGDGGLYGAVQRQPCGNGYPFSLPVYAHRHGGQRPFRGGRLELLRPGMDRGSRLAGGVQCPGRCVVPQEGNQLKWGLSPP